MKAIFTKYLGPTNSRGSRIKAWDGDNNSVTLHWDDALNSDENHVAACRALCDKVGWSGRMIMGSHKEVNVHVFCEIEYEHGKSQLHETKSYVGKSHYKEV